VLKNQGLPVLILDSEVGDLYPVTLDSRRRVGLGEDPVDELEVGIEVAFETSVALGEAVEEDGQARGFEVMEELALLSRDLHFKLDGDGETFGERPLSQVELLAFPLRSQALLEAHATLTTVEEKVVIAFKRS